MNVYEMLSALAWAVDQAEENLGQHTGGPNEATYRDNLRDAKDALEKVRLNFAAL